MIYGTVDDVYRRQEASRDILRHIGRHHARSDVISTSFVALTRHSHTKS